MVVPEMAAAALATLDRRARDRLRHGEQVVEIEGGVPAGVVLAMSADADAARERAQPRQTFERPLHLRLGAHDADQVLHHVLQLVLNPVRTLAVAAGGERLDGARRGFVGLAASMGRLRLGFGELRGEFTRAFAEHQQIRQRIAAEPIRAVDAGGALACREQAGHRRHLRLGVHAHAAHDVVRRRPHFHRLAM